MNFSTKLRIARQNLQKRRNALSETIDLDNFLLNKDFEIQKNPFPHIVVDNFFKNEVYDGLLRHFNSVLSRGFSQDDDATRFHPFLNLKGKFAYDGYLYVPRLGETPELSLFPSLAWNMLFSSVFKQPSGWCTSFAYHHHPVGNTTGFVHHDYASKVFSPLDRLRNGVIYRERGEGSGAPVFRQRRVIALIYYLGNEEWKEGDGGETGLYKTAAESPVAFIAPKNNRLLAFNISPASFHAFQQNFAPRSSITQWFHIDEPWAQEKYGFL